MDVAFHTQGQGTKAVDPEAPALEQILALAADLTKDSLPEQIKIVLGATAKAALGPIAKDSLIVRANVAKGQLATAPATAPIAPGGGAVPSTTSSPNDTGAASQPHSKPRRFYGSVEIDMNRPVKSFDTILNSVVMELQRSPSVKLKLTLEIEAEAPSGFNDADVGVVRDNTKQLKFTPGSIGFSD